MNMNHIIFKRDGSRQNEQKVKHYSKNQTLKIKKVELAVRNIK